MTSQRLVGRWQLLLRRIVAVDGSSLLVQLRLLLLAKRRGRHLRHVLGNWRLFYGGRWQRQLILVTTAASGCGCRRWWLWSSGTVEMTNLLRRMGPILHVQILHAGREVVDGRWSVDRWRGRIQWSREAGRGSRRCVDQVRVDPTRPVVVWAELVITAATNNGCRQTLTRRRLIGNTRGSRTRWQLRRRHVIVN